MKFSSILKSLFYILCLTALVSCGSKKDNEDGPIDPKDTMEKIDTSARVVYDFELEADSTDHKKTDSLAIGMKIGYVNSGEILLLMPEIKAADARLQTFAAKLEAEFQKKSKEFQDKYIAYSSDSSVSQSIVDMRVSELEGMQNRLQQLQYASEQDLQKQKTKEYQPILDKLNRAIETVAKQQNFSHVIDLGSGALVYGLPEYDITESVKRKLKIK